MKLLVVGAGLFGATVAHERALKGDQVDVIEKRSHLAGNIFTEEVEGIQVHRYGAHIFHTSNKKIWEYINQFSSFNRYTNEVIANYKGEIYNLPFNMNTFNKMWGVITPAQAKAEIDKQRASMAGKVPQNLEEQAISLVGKDIYEKLIRDYTAKQWGREPKELPSFIIRRLPVRFTYDNNYFNDLYQGIPEGGYTQIVEKMLDHANIKVHLNTDFLTHKEEYLTRYDQVVYTGMIDQFFDYQLGALEYRKGNQGKTVITREFPAEWSKGDEPYYPVNDTKNNHLFTEYRDLATKKYPQVAFGGRLGLYRYYNMDQVITAALQFVKGKFFATN